MPEEPPNYFLNEKEQEIIIFIHYIMKLLPKLQNYENFKKKIKAFKYISTFRFRASMVPNEININFMNLAN